MSASHALWAAIALTWIYFLPAFVRALRPDLRAVVRRRYTVADVAIAFVYGAMIAAGLAGACARAGWW